ncbi:hypothetical protein LC653_40330 [Nostoc sp. CHAB 5784]|uniref:hypothetical protein n=1 Tax=Nostoc mirabile TaxID=2907820 RepID=UPI001E4C77D8|nr:hypothetical protein [Nostoc mirabile]MCC5669890.1 hypothetical protein [Nostoc mirabile CHAB5784]
MPFAEQQCRTRVRLQELAGYAYALWNLRHSTSVLLWGKRSLVCNFDSKNGRERCLRWTAPTLTVVTRNLLTVTSIC